MLKQFNALWFVFILALGLVLSGCPADDDDDSAADDDDVTAADDDDATGDDDDSAGDDDDSAGDDDDSAGDDDDATGDDDDSAGDDDDSAVAQSACQTYCTAAMTNCTGADAIYGTAANCMAACAAMPEGSPTDTSGNTAYCRAYHADVAGSSGQPATHCPHASTTSDSGICGTSCEAYCSQAMANCTGTGLGADFADLAECQTACALYPSGAWNDTAVNTVQCRTYHASFPAAGAPGAHCDHAGPSGAGVCVDTAGR